MARKTNQRKRKGNGKKVYSIIVDGKTEVWYFQMLKKHENLHKFDIKPELPKHKTLQEQYDLVIENAKIYDKVIWLVDFDTLIKESRETKNGGRSKMDEFKFLKDKKLQNCAKNIKNKVTILVNNPCLEFWFLLHFEETGKFFSKCESAEKQLKTHLKSYEKTQKYHTQINSDIYKRLKPFLENALENAKKLGEFDIENPTSAKAEIYQVFELLKNPNS